MRCLDTFAAPGLNVPERGRSRPGRRTNLSHQPHNPLIRRMYHFIGCSKSGFDGCTRERRMSSGAPAGPITKKGLQPKGEKHEPTMDEKKLEAGDTPVPDVRGDAPGVCLRQDVSCAASGGLRPTRLRRTEGPGRQSGAVCGGRECSQGKGSFTPYPRS
jgi:hypothetical protein